MRSAVGRGAVEPGALKRWLLRRGTLELRGAWPKGLVEERAGALVARAGLGWACASVLSSAALSGVVAAQVATPVVAQTITNDSVRGQFGASLAVAGNALAVGVPSAVGAPGTAQIFSRVDGLWHQPEVVVPLSCDVEAACRTPEPSFGTAVAVSDEWLAVGALGAVYLYAREGGPSGPRFMQRLTTPVPASAPSEFGAAVAIDGDVLAVGDPAANDFRGAVYTFDCDTQASRLWVANDVFVPSGADTEFEEFGAAVAVRAGLVAGGAPAFDGGRGRVVTFDVGEAAAGQVQVIPGRDSQGFFGQSLALSENQLVIGAPGAGERGELAVFTLLAHVAMAPNLVQAPASAVGGFGRAVALQGNRVLAGSGGPLGGGGAGQLFLLTAASGEIVVSEPLVSSGDDGALAGLGRAVALSDQQAFVSAPIGSADRFGPTVTVVDFE